MLGLCLYVPVPYSDPIEVQYFESDRLPAELKALFKLSVFLPSQELSKYQKWRKVKVYFFVFLTLAFLVFICSLLFACVCVSRCYID